MQRLVIAAVACVALAGFAGCGDDEEDDSAAGGAQTQEAPAQTAPAETETSAGDDAAASGGGGETITVTMKDFAFSPAEVQAKVGDTIEWVNEDEAPHNAVDQDGDLRTSTFQKGGSDTYTLDEAGTIEYICTVHPQMQGTIVVQE